MKNYYTWSLSDKCLAITTTTSLGNMAFQVAQNPNEVEENRKSLFNELQIASDEVVFVHQTHSDVIKETIIEDRGKGKNSFESGIEADALYTKSKRLGLGIFHADCEPIFFIHEESGIIGIIHAGFKGTMKHIAYKAIKELCKKEDIEPEDIKIFVGPLRREKSFEVDKESMRQIRAAGFRKCVANSHFNLALANKCDLLKAGIKEENIQDCLINTFEEANCYSAIRKTPVGRMASIIMLN